MSYGPQDFLGLTEAESLQMRELKLTRAQFDLHRLRVAHGDLCAAMIHGRRAEVFFKGYDAPVAVKIANLLAKLGEIVPSYEDFDKSTRRSRR